MKRPSTDQLSFFFLSLPGFVVPLLFVLDLGGGGAVLPGLVLPEGCVVVGLVVVGLVVVGLVVVGLVVVGLVVVGLVVEGCVFVLLWLGSTLPLFR